MDKTGKSVKKNILLGYISFILIAAVMLGVIYNEVIKLTQNKVDIKPVNDKISLVNALTTNLYQAEGFERSYLQTKNKKHYQAYIELMDNVGDQIDSLGHITSNPSQHLHTDSIQILLTQKRKNFKELVDIKNAGSSEELYQKSMLGLTSERDSINKLLSIYKTVTTSKDSILVLQNKQRFFERVMNIFSSQEQTDSTVKIVVNQTTQTDSILDDFNPADSVAEFLTLVIEDIKKESIAQKRKLNKKEQEILENNKIITLKIRQMFIRFENEIVNSSLQQVAQQQKAVSKMTRFMVVLSTLALIVIVGFLILILKDISKSQHYRQRLEREKAYSETLLKNKEQFMLSITHDLKSPLSSIIGYSHLARREREPQHKKRYLENIDQSASYILHLINNLIDFVRLETGKIKIENVRFNLNLLLDEVIDGFYPLASKKDINLTMHETLPRNDIFVSDPMRIKQVLGNLISNAIKFTDKGQVVMKCSVMKTEDKTVWVQFVVEDTGIGISAENTKIIFEEFSRVSPEDGRQYEGTGLGLTITKRIVELLNGKMSLKSHYGKGSSFSICLPLKRLPENAKLQQSKKEHNQVVEATSVFNNQHILLVDDDSVLLEMTMRILQANKLNIKSFSDPREAMLTLQKEAFDVLITDIQMPLTNGFELLASFKKYHPQAKAIAVTGKALNATDVEKAGFSAFLEKPFQPDELVNLIASVLSGNKTTTGKTSYNYNSDSEYTLESIKAFAANDPKTMRNILASFIDTTAQNVRLFKEYLNKKDINALSELAHKMLPLFRQLGVETVVKPLAELEQNTFDDDKTRWMELGETTLKNVVRLVKKICKDHQFSLPDELIL